MAIDMFKTRTLIETLRQMKPARSFLLETFFPQEQTHSTDKIDIDIVKGKRRVAPFVKATAQGTKVERIGYTTETFTPPYIKPKMETTAQDFLQREPGNTVYGPHDGPQQRAEKKLSEDLQTLDDMITRQEERMASEILQTGVVTIVGEGFNGSIDFGFDASHQVTLGAGFGWNEANGVPLQNLRTWRRLIAQDSGLVPRNVVMGSSALDAFLSNAEVKDQLDNRKILNGQIDPQVLPNGVVYYGVIKDVGLDLWTYDEWYIDPTDGLEKPMVDPQKIILGTPEAKAIRHYGPIQDIKAGNFVTKRFAKSWDEEDPSVRWLLVQSAPLPVPHQVDAFFNADVVV